MNSYEFFIKKERKNIDFLNKIFEAYEGVGIVRTLDAEAGEIKLITIDIYREDILKIIEDINNYGVFLEVSREGLWGGEL